MIFFVFTEFTGKDRPRYREELAPAERLVMAWAAGLPCWAMTFVMASLSQDVFILLSFEKLDRSNLWLLLFVGTDNGGSSWVLFRILAEYSSGSISRASSWALSYFAFERSRVVVESNSNQAIIRHLRSWIRRS